MGNVPALTRVSNTDAPRDVRPRVIETRELFGQEKEVRILHHGIEYRLRITRQGKLILTK